MRYKQLDVSRFETRFLRLVERGSPPKLLMRFELDTASLSRPPRYHALSYCWGDPSQTGTIEVDGEPVEISRILLEALRHVHLEIGSLFWADAICINQKDLFEKSYQVNLMGQIYSKAEKAIVWLGLEATYSHLARDLLSQFDSEVRHRQRLLALQAKNPQTGPSNAPATQSESILAFSLRRHEQSIRALRGVHELLTRPYWERVWIIQEIAKAPSVDVICGHLQFELEVIFSVAKVLKDLPRRNQTLLQAIDQFRNLERQRHGASSRMALLEALVISRHSLATDQRDKVYAVLGLTRDGNDLVPTPSYTDSVSEVFARLTTEMLQSHMVTDVPSLARWVPLTLGDSSSPRWAINWADLDFSIPPWVISTSIPAKQSEFSSYQPRGVSPDGTKLHTSGRVIATSDRGGEYPRPSYISMSEFSPKPKKYVLDVMRRVCSDLLDRLAPGNVAAGTVSREYLTDALARMIRDAEKGFPSHDYDLGAVQDVLTQLGMTEISDDHVQELARQYNFLKTSGKSTGETLAVPKESTEGAAGRRRSFWRRDSKRTSDIRYPGTRRPIRPRGERARDLARYP